MVHSVDSLGYIFVADTVRLASTNMTQLDFGTFDSPYTIFY